MFAFKEEDPMSAMATMAMADVTVPFYQPIIGRDRQVKGYEALARRWDPVAQCYKGIDFASLSQDESLHLDIVMLRAIMRDLPLLAQKGPYALSINLNPALSSPTYRNLLLLVLLQARKLGIDIWFEVLEYARLESRYRELIEVLRAHGAHIACDDFGSLECNFQRLMALPYEVVKLDRSLLLQAACTAHAFKMLVGLVAYLQRLGMAVVCEGVETQSHVEIANRLGCDYQQGYAYAMPSPLSRWS
ncbi:EAL domain-containing protein [Aeromonas rivipollensis]